MLTLKYNDLTDFSTLTSKLFNKRQQEIEWLEAKVEKMKSFDIALTNYLQTHGEMSLDLYDKICVMFEHSDKTVSEIFMEIEKRGWQNPFLVLWFNVCYTKQKIEKNGKHLTKIKIYVILLLENEKEKNFILIFV